MKTCLFIYTYSLHGLVEYSCISSEEFFSNQVTSYGGGSQLPPAGPAEAFQASNLPLDSYDFAFSSYFSRSVPKLWVQA